MHSEIMDLQKRIKQLEDSMRAQSMFVPDKPDPSLAEDEWYAIFSDFQNTTSGTITKVPWRGGSNMTAVFVVKRIR
jgi:hypothetical protein